MDLGIDGKIGMLSNFFTLKTQGHNSKKIKLLRQFKQINSIKSIAYIFAVFRTSKSQ